MLHSISKEQRHLVLCNLRQFGMKKIIWKIQFLTAPRILRHCKKCGKKRAFICSKQFRINAQRRNLDIWLIYKCSECDATWNAEIFSRISPKSLDAKILDGFYRNDNALAGKYAMDISFLRRNGVEVEPPQYSVIGDCFSPDEAVELEIKSEYFSPIKISSIIKSKLHISQKEYLRLVSDGRIKSVPNQDLKKCKLKDGIILIFNESNKNN